MLGRLMSNIHYMTNVRQFEKDHCPTLHMLCIFQPIRGNLKIIERYNKFIFVVGTITANFLHGRKVVIVFVVL